MITICLYIISFIVAFIIFELLKQTGTIQAIKEVFYTHPKFDKYVRIFGEIIVNISVGVIGAAVYQWFLDAKIIYYAFLFGIIWLIIGAFLKEYEG